MCVWAYISVCVNSLFPRKLKEQSSYDSRMLFRARPGDNAFTSLQSVSLFLSNMWISAFKGGMARVSWEWYFVRRRSGVLSAFRTWSPLLDFGLAASNTYTLWLQSGDAWEAKFCVLALSSNAEVIQKA